MADSAIPLLNRKTREPRGSAKRRLLAIIVAVIAVIGLAAAGSASARPAFASAASGQTLPANFSRVPASWHGYAPPAAKSATNHAAKANGSAAADSSGGYCTGAETLYNGNSGLVMEVYDSSTAAGGIIDQWTFNATETQFWCFFLVSAPGNALTIYEIVNNNSGMCLDLPGDNLFAGAHLQQWPCNGTEAQDWLWTNVDTYDTLAPYTYANITSNFSYLMEISSSDKSDGGQVDVWTNDFTVTQTWCPGTACIGAGTTTNLCVDNASENNMCILGGLNNNQGQAQLTNEEDIITENFAYPDTEFATTPIQSYSGGNCLQLNVAGGYTVRLAPCVNDAAEEWTNIYDSTYDRTEFVSYYDPSLCLSANYSQGILMADPCSNNGWYQQWGTS